MTYTPQGPFTTGGTATAANLTAMDNGISTNDTAISGSQTPSESATPAASGSVASLLAFIVSQIKLITGGAHWYSAPVATLASLLSSVNANRSSISANTTAINGKANTSGATFSGQVYVAAPDVLVAGHQESGFCAVYAYTSISNGYYASSINFKSILQNNPSSISISASLRNSGSNSTFADTWNQYGFRMQCHSASGGAIDVAGTYTTVGNCLLKVNKKARTFDHHCDMCGALNHAQPLAALDVHDSRSGYSGLAVVFRCPVCDATETFDVRMTSTDESDETPQGSGEYATTRGAQARLIRQLLTLLELPTAD